MIINILFIILILAIFWYWYIVKNDPVLPVVKYEDINFKTGDLILMHSYDNSYPVLFGTYWTHVGIVYKPPDTGADTDTGVVSNPLILEAVNLTGSKYINPDMKNGIVLMDLKNRLEKYHGYLAYKRLDKPLDKETIDNFKVFIEHVKKNFSYNTKVISNVVKKLGGEKLNNKTNCGELVILSLIKLKLLSRSVYKNKIWHSLLYTIKLKKLNNNKYNDLVKIFINPFY